MLLKVVGGGMSSNLFLEFSYAFKWNEDAGLRLG